MNLHDFSTSELRWVPSQNGLFFERPHLQSAVLPSFVSEEPSLWTRVTVPFTMYGPFSSTVTLTLSFVSTAVGFYSGPKTGSEEEPVRSLKVDPVIA
jgi:hypothetical protein